MEGVSRQHKRLGQTAQSFHIKPGSSWWWKFPLSKTISGRKPRLQRILWQSKHDMTPSPAMHHHHEHGLAKDDSKSLHEPQWNQRVITKKLGTTKNPTRYLDAVAKWNRILTAPRFNARHFKKQNRSVIPWRSPVNVLCKWVSKQPNASWNNNVAQETDLKSRHERKSALDLLLFLLLFWFWLSVCDLLSSVHFCYAFYFLVDWSRRLKVS